MAHRASEIELSPGVTVISGPNNIGKSAIVEAIRHLVANPAPKNVIRHGANQALVRLELDSGEIISWQRRETSASYLIQRTDPEKPGAADPPEEYHKFGREVPEDVRALLRLEPVKTDTDDLDIHIGNQRQPIFLLDRPGSHAAGFFAASTEADYLLKMQQALKRRIDSAKNTRKALDAELAAIAEQLKELEPLDDLADRIELAESLYALIIRTESEIPRLAEVINRLQEMHAGLAAAGQAREILSSLEGPPVWQDISGLNLIVTELQEKTRQNRWEFLRAGVLDELATPPVLAATADLEALLRQSRATQGRFDEAQATSQTLTPLAAPPDLAATAELEALLRQSRAIQSRLDGAQTISQFLADLTVPPDLAEVKELSGSVQAMGQLAEKTGILQDRHTVLARHLPPPRLDEVSQLHVLLTDLRGQHELRQRREGVAGLLAKVLPPPELEATADLEHSLAALGQAEASLSREQNRLDQATRQLQEKKAEIQEYLQAAGVCPLCGSPLDMEHFLESRHA